MSHPPSALQSRAFLAPGDLVLPPGLVPSAACGMDIHAKPANLEQNTDPVSDIGACAYQLVDVHGRWARYVALTCAAKSAWGENEQHERFWCAVFAAIRDMQLQPAA